MPAVLESCVMKVREKGHDESSAYAICRDSLGLKADDDGASLQMTDEELDKKIKDVPPYAKPDPAKPAESPVKEEAAAVEDPAKAAAMLEPAPSFVKDIVVARAGKNFVNGKQAFDLKPSEIDEIIKNFTLLGKQVPLLLTEDHIFGGRKSAIPAAGWVEKMYRDGGDWHCVCKFVGEAAVLVSNDQFRGVSIGTVMARDVHGREVGEAMDHLLITNAPFFNNLNIAASESATSAGRVRYICATEAQEKEPAMADPVITPEAIEAAVKAATESRDGDIVRMTRENLELVEENGRLKSQLKDYTSPAEKKELVEKILELKEIAFVAQVRSIVHRGLSEGRFAPVWCKGYDGKDALDNAGTMRWFRASKFYNENLPNPDQQAFHFLRFASETYPVMYRMGQIHSSGTPLPGVGRMFAMSTEEKQALRAKGFDPARLAAINPDDMTYEEWQSQVGIAGKEQK